MRVDDGKRLLTVIGLLEPTDDLSRRALESLLIADIATAQEVLGRVGRIDRIDLIVEDSELGQADLARIAAVLPPDARVALAAGRAGTVNEMTEAFRLNLTALSLLALVVGVFLIYNTVTFSVIQRRPVLGSLRALGMTRREIFATILVEAAMHGAVGTLAGLVLGVVLGRGAVQMVTQTMNDLFFVVAVREVQIPTATLVKGGIIGMAAALVGAAIPAWEATSVAPAGALKRSDVEERTRKILPWVSAGALAMLVLGALLLIPDWNLVVAFGGLFAVIIGIALLTPVATLGLMQGAERLVRGRRRHCAHGPTHHCAFAEPHIGGHRRADGGGQRDHRRGRHGQQLPQHGRQLARRHPPGRHLHFAAKHELQSDPQRVWTGVGSRGRSTAWRGQCGDDPQCRCGGLHAERRQRNWNGNSQATVDESIAVRLVSFSEDLAGADRRYRQSIGDWQETWTALEAGGIIINEPMANRYGLTVGDDSGCRQIGAGWPFPLSASLSISTSTRPRSSMIRSIAGCGMTTGFRPSVSLWKMMWMWTRRWRRFGRPLPGRPSCWCDPIGARVRTRWRSLTAPLPSPSPCRCWPRWWPSSAS